MVALTVVVQGILEVVEVQELVSSFADEVERILEQGQERLEWNQDVGCDGGALEDDEIINFTEVEEKRVTF